jgi:hypothetical protein
LGFTVRHDDEEHGYIDGLPPFTENPNDDSYNLATEAADKILELAKGNITFDHWRRR